MNPRVSRSPPRWRPKPPGFPIAKIAALLAVGYRLDELPNDITKKTPASFEPTIDYTVVKIPRFAFEKFTAADQTLNTAMKSVGEVMALGRTFKEALQKALRGLEIGSQGLGADKKSPGEGLLTHSGHAGGGKRPPDGSSARPHPRAQLRPDFLYPGRAQGGRPRRRTSSNGPKSIPGSSIRSKKSWNARNRFLRAPKSNPLTPTTLLLEAKRYGFSDVQIGLSARRRPNSDVRALARRRKKSSRPINPSTPARRNSRRTRPITIPPTKKKTKSIPSDKKKVMILGGGPNRIGQGIEFDYCCVHAVMALKEEGYETIMVNCNPETVSTDYDTSDKLYFEPLTLEDVLNIVEKEKPEGVIVQFGGQTPLNLAIPLEKAGVKILGTSPDSIDLAEDRKRFGALLTKLGIPQAPNGTARSFEEARADGRAHHLSRHGPAQLRSGRARHGSGL